MYFSETKTAGTGATGIETQLARNNEIHLGRWKNNKLHLIVFNMNHVNEALTHYVDGSIGTDIFLKGKAIIDYCNHCLYLK